MNTSDTYYSLGYNILSDHSKKHNVVKNTIDFMVDNCKNANWDVVIRAMKILEEPRPKCEYTEKLWNFMNKKMNFYFRQDMIYYGICNDGVRL